MNSHNGQCRWVLLVFLGCVPAVAMAGMRCGNQLIDKGSSGAEVTAFCGAPTQVEHSVMYVGGVPAAGPDRAGGTTAEVQVEIWTYNFGPNMLMERLRIEDGIVTDIQSLGYGFNEP